MKYIKTGLKPMPNEIEMKEMMAKGQIPPQAMQQRMAQNLQGMPSEKYYGPVASGYDKKRENQSKWTVEQSIVERMLSDFPAGSWVLDAPCGTGRFFPYYHGKRFMVRGVDISPDMLAEASKKIINPAEMIDGEPMWAWSVRNIIEEGTGLEDSSVDAAVSVRFTRWAMGQYGPEGIKKLLQELQRVARAKVIFTARVKDHPAAVPLELIEDSLQPEWTIHENAEGYEEAYRIISLGPAA